MFVCVVLADWLHLLYTGAMQSKCIDSYKGATWYFYPQPHPPGFPGNTSNYFMNPPTHPWEQPALGNAAKKNNALSQISWGNKNP